MRRLRTHAWHHHRRHQIRVRSRRARHAYLDRRSAHARFLTLLARRFLPAWRQPTELRQAVRARLPGIARLEQEASGAEAAGRGDCQDGGEISRSADAADELNLNFNTTREKTDEHRACFEKTPADTEVA